MINLCDYLIRTEREHGDKPSITAEDGTLTWREFATNVRRFASCLRSKGVMPGDRIMLLLPNGTDYLTAYLGGLWAGATVVPVDYTASAATIMHMWQDSGSSVAVSDGKRANLLKDLPWTPVPTDLATLPEWDAHEEARQNPTALLLYTNGTTGLPKGVRVDHQNLIFTAQAIIGWAGLRGGDKELTTLRLTHSFGLGQFHCYLMTGGQFFIEPSLNDVPGILNKIEANAVTGFPSTPAAIRMLLDNYGDLFRQKARNLRYMIVNSAPMAPDLTQRLLDALPNTDIYMYYGLTEASRTTYIHYNRHRDKLASVGRPPDGVEVRIKAIDDIPSPKGEIQIRGGNVTPGYWGRPPGESFDNGWFATGDVGHIDEDGLLFVTGRIKEQINIDGLKCNPEEVELILRQHPAVRDCAVIGLKDPVTHERVVACILPRPEYYSETLALELRRYCKGKIDVFKIPREVRFVDEIPRTDSGKLQRLSLKRRLEEGVQS